MVATNGHRHEQPSQAAIQEELESLIAGPLSSSPLLSRFLRFVVEETLAGRGDQLKEYKVATQGLGRPESFEPASDSSVRVAARQLRFKLREHYANGGGDRRVVIDVLKGGYVPQFSSRGSAAPGTGVIGISPAGQTGASDGATSSRSPVSSTSGWWKRPLVAASILGLAVAAIGITALRLQLGDVRTHSAPVIAVLPFANFTGTSDDAVLSDGVTDEVTLALAHDTSTRVIARTSAWTFRDQRVDVREVGRQLGAQYIIEGSLKRTGNGYRVSVQLNRAADGIEVWAEQYDVNRASLFEASHRAAASARHAVLDREGRSSALVTQRRPRDPAVGELMLEGRYFWNQRTDSGLARAVDRFTRATRIDSSYAPAWAARAGVYATMEVNQVMLPGRAASLAFASASRALALDSSLGEAWTAIGMMRGFHDWQWATADTAFRRAIALSPSYATARSWYSNVLLAQGQIDAALTQLEQARRLDPLSMPIAYGIAQAYYYGRRWDPGLAAIERVLALSPDNNWAQLLKGKLLKGAGRITEARQVFAQLKDSVELALLAPMTRGREIPRLMAKLTEAERSRAQFWIATNYAQIGWSDSTFAWLERGFNARQSDMSSVLVDPMIDPVKDDPRYAALVARMGLSAVWRPLRRRTNS